MVYASLLCQRFAKVVLNTILDVGKMEEETVRICDSMARSGESKASCEMRFGSGSDVGAEWSCRGIFGWNM